MDEMTVLTFKERAGCDGGGKGILITENRSFTLSTLLDEAICYTVDCRNLCLNKEKSGTLQSKNQGGHSLNYQNPVLIEKRDFQVESIGHDLRSTQFSRGGAATP